MITQYEIAEFRNVNQFTGEDLVELIRENDLEEYELYSLESEYIKPEPSGLPHLTSHYVYVVKFRRRK